MTSALTDKTSSGRARARAVLASLAFAATVFAAAPAPAEDLIVKYDQSQLLRLPRAASEIIIGNPAIADVSVQAGNLLVVTGKTFGITNIIALDADRNVIQDQRILVRRDELKVVNLMRGTERQSYNCTPQCNPSITVGDEQKYFDSISRASRAKISFSSGQAQSSQQSGNQ
jgi:Flp pilus assembly secretin CpaC